ncbi:MAG TPA: hypothetical protein VH681_13745 [Nitrospiraceae bacterium]
MLKAIFLVLSLPLATEQSPNRSVRTTEPEVQALLDNATSRSETFRSLITALNESDIIVYVETSVTRAAKLRGHLVHRIVAKGTHRYLRLRLNPFGPVEQRIGVIAHELQHALEIAQALNVGRSETVQSFFELIGFTHGTQCGDCYETTRALDVERTVREELRASRSTISQCLP